MQSIRPPFVKLFLVIVLIPIGILTKVYSGIGSEFANNYLGGVIYVVFFIVLASLVFPNANPLKTSLFVVGITCLIEVSQLIQNDLLNNLRTHFLIGSLIGGVFNVFDFIFYFVGGLIGYGILSNLKNRS
jgi:glycopeptide antibiotics resistance protein